MKPQQSSFSTIDHSRNAMNKNCNYCLQQMRRKNNKQNGKNIDNVLNRAQSQGHFALSLNRTLAELNQPGARDQQKPYKTNEALRIMLPAYFNIPKFTDIPLILNGNPQKQIIFRQSREQGQMRAKLKDLDVLAEGMRRAKNIKEESRYYFMQAVLQHNCKAYAESIKSLEKFLKIVLFIRDEKSVELALNAIGTEYMYLGEFQKAIEYHKKQREFSERADLFPSHVNAGLCLEIEGDFESALAQYQIAADVSKADKQINRKQLASRLMQRVQSKKNSTFITTELKQQKEENEQSFMIQPSTLRFREKKKNGKLDWAIRSAQQHMDQYLLSMKNSFIADKK